jgi:hypothetical protein
MGTNGSFGSVRKLPSGKFQVRYFHLGRRIAADSTFATKADARAFLAGVEGAVALIDRMARPADDVWAVRSDRCGQFVERCRDA